MTIQKTTIGTALEFNITGRIDTTTAPQLEKALKEILPDITDLKLNFAQVDYISSAGLRVLLAAQKKMNAQGSMSVSNVSESVMEVFDVTGFSNILTIL